MIAVDENYRKKLSSRQNSELETDYLAEWNPTEGKLKLWRISIIKQEEEKKLLLDWIRNEISVIYRIVIKSLEQFIQSLSNKAYLEARRLCFDRKNHKKYDDVEWFHSFHALLPCVSVSVSDRNKFIDQKMKYFPHWTRSLRPETLNCWHL